MPGTCCLRMRLIKSPFCDVDVFVWVGGFAHDVDTQQVQLDRAQVSASHEQY